jgi:hypothetical protein
VQPTSRGRRWPWTAEWSCSNVGEEKERAVPGPLEVGRRSGGTVGAARRDFASPLLGRRGRRQSQLGRDLRDLLPPERGVTARHAAAGVRSRGVVRAANGGVWGARARGIFLALIGTTLVAGALWSQVFLVPRLAEASPEVTDRGTGSVLAGFLLSFLKFGVGWVVVGVATCGPGCSRGGPLFCSSSGRCRRYYLFPPGRSYWKSRRLASGLLF